jgi:hypothetical protein
MLKRAKNKKGTRSGCKKLKGSLSQLTMTFFCIGNLQQNESDVPVYLKQYDNGIAHYVFYPVIVTTDTEKKWLVERCEVALHLTMSNMLMLDRSSINYIGNPKYEEVCSNQIHVGFISYRTSKAIIDKTLHK